MAETRETWDKLLAYHHTVMPAEWLQRRPDPTQWRHFRTQFDHSMVAVDGARWAAYLPHFIASLGVGDDRDGWKTNKMEEMRAELRGGEWSHCVFTDQSRVGAVDDIVAASEATLKYVECSVFMRRELDDGTGDACKYHVAYVKKLYEYSGYK